MELQENHILFNRNRVYYRKAARQLSCINKDSLNDIRKRQSSLIVNSKVIERITHCKKTTNKQTTATKQN